MKIEITKHEPDAVELAATRIAKVLRGELWEVQKAALSMVDESLDLERAYEEASLAANEQ